MEVGVSLNLLSPCRNFSLHHFTIKITPPTSPHTQNHSPPPTPPQGAVKEVSPFFISQLSGSLNTRAGSVTASGSAPRLNTGTRLGPRKLSSWISQVKSSFFCSFLFCQLVKCESWFSLRSDSCFIDLIWFNWY